MGVCVYVFDSAVCDCVCVCVCGCVCTCVYVCLFVCCIDEFDRKKILVRVTGRVRQLAQCGIALSKRFVFVDKVFFPKNIQTKRPVNQTPGFSGYSMLTGNISVRYQQNQKIQAPVLRHAGERSQESVQPINFAKVCGKNYRHKKGPKIEAWSFFNCTTLVFFWRCVVSFHVGGWLSLCY